ncbi:hypothetical protein [Pseudomonas sp.]|uniref:hypothetical protein n=1 Tax=Pseudomonas sp. TaxID=306 RepID=UPI00258E9CBD|nr:hypothetical protein [Pseudomonas sp.]
MFNNVRKFLALFSGAFIANRMPQFIDSGPEIHVEQRRQGKGKGRRSPAPKNAAIHKREAKKRKGRAINKARHAG